MHTYITLIITTVDIGILVDFHLPYVLAVGMVFFAHRTAFHLHLHIFDLQIIQKPQTLSLCGNCILLPWEEQTMFPFCVFDF